MMVSVGPHITVFKNAAVSSCFSVLISLIIVLCLNWRLGRLAWLLAALGLEAAIAYRATYRPLLQRHSIKVWAGSYLKIKIVGAISGVFMAAFWLVSIGIAMSTTVADSMVGQMIIPMLVIVMERVISGSLRRGILSWVKTAALTALAYALCIGAAVLFLWYIENDQSQIGEALKKAWLLVPAILTAVPFCLLVFVERR